MVEDLKAELPNVKTFVTLSPVPGFAAWLTARAGGRDSELLDAEASREALALLDEPGWHLDPAKAEAVRAVLLPLAAHYFLKARDRPGARSTRWRASTSATARGSSG